MPKRHAPTLPPWAFPAALACIAVAEVVWFAWYVTVPLPNAEAAKTTLPDGTIKSEAIRRWYLLAEAIPYFVPGNDWDDSLLGQTLGQFTQVGNLVDRLPIVLAALLIASAGVGLGLLAIRALGLGKVLRWTERIPLAFGLGLAGLGVVTLILGRFGLLAAWPIRLGLGGLAVAGIGPEVAARIRHRREGTESSTINHRSSTLLAIAAFALAAGPFLLLMAMGSLQPSLDFDSLEYHLQGPKEWYLAGRIGFLPHNVYTTMPFNVEMLHLLGMVVLGDWWTGALAGQFLVMLHAPMAAAMIALAASRLGSPRAGWFAAVVYLATPWAYRLSVFAYVEGPLGYYHAALIWVASLAWSSPPLGIDRGMVPRRVGTAHRSAEGSVGGAHPTKTADSDASRSTIDHRPSTVGLWAASGALAGGAMACKYPALISAVIPFGVMALADSWRRRSWAVPLAFAAGLAVTIGPWLAKNVVDHGNPVYPLAGKVFGGHPWSPAREAKWSAAHGTRPITLPELVTGLLDVAGRNDWQSPLYVALAPLALLRPRSWRGALALFGYAAYLFATWWLLTHRLDRFWVPILPALAVLAGLGSDWTRRWPWWLVLAPTVALGLAATWIYDTTGLAALNRWTDPLARLRVEVPRLASPTLAWLDANLPPDAKILLVGQAGVFHMRHSLLYNTVFDEEHIERIATGRSPGEIHRSLQDLGITHILVDWSEIARHRKAGGYGFTPFVTPELFARLVGAGVIEPAAGPGPKRELYRVR